MIKLLVFAGLTLQPLPAKPPTPADAVVAAEADAAAIFSRDAVLAASTRYYTAHHIADDPPLLEREYAAFSLHVNLLSRGARVVKPRRVADWLWAIDARDYHWDLTVVAKLVDDDTWTHAVLVVEENGKRMKRPKADEKTKVPAVPPWLPEAEFRRLNEYVQSGRTAGLLRYDFFMNRTAIAERRDGFSYYDILGVKNEKEAEKLARLDRAAAETAFRELAAAVRRSSVAHRNRQIFRYATILGAWWETRDPDESVQDSNALNRKFGAFRFVGKEVIFTLPNGLPAFFLFNDKGELAKSGPPQLVGDDKTWDTDARVHPYMSCVRCHLGGALRPIDDYVRTVFEDGRGLKLGAADVPDKDHPEILFSERVRSAYLGDLAKWYKRDEGDFAAAYESASGVKAAQVPLLVARSWAMYEDDDVGIVRYGRELGIPPTKIRGALEYYLRENRLDETLAGLVLKNPDVEVPLRRDHAEEAVFYVYDAVYQYQQKGCPDEPRSVNPRPAGKAGDGAVPVVPAIPDSDDGGGDPARPVPGAGRPAVRDPGRPGGPGAGGADPGDVRRLLPAGGRDPGRAGAAAGGGGKEDRGVAIQLRAPDSGREDAGLPPRRRGEVPKLPRRGRGRRRRVRAAVRPHRDVAAEAAAARVESHVQVHASGGPPAAEPGGSGRHHRGVQAVREMR